MKKRIVLLLALLPMLLTASGYKANSTGIKQLGMGFVGVSLPLDAQAIYANPGMLSNLEPGLHFNGGVTLISSKVGLRNEKEGWTAATDNPLAPPFNVYGAYVMENGLSFGLGVYLPYGSTVQYEKDWEGSHLLNNLALSTFFIQPTVSYKIADWISVGAGLTIVLGSVEQERNLGRNVTDDKGNRSFVAVEASTTAFGFNAGVLLTPLKELRVGVNYRSGVEVETDDGKATFSNIHPALSTLIPATNTVSASIPLPAEITAGLSYDVTDQLTLAFDYNFIFWEDYKSLDLDFKNNTARLPDSFNPRNWENAGTFRLGAQYKLNPMFVFRAGSSYDMSSLPKDFFIPDTPLDDILGFTLGTSVQLTDVFGLDLAVARYGSIGSRSDRYIGYKETNPATQQPVEVPFEFEAQVVAWYYSVGFSVKL